MKLATSISSVNPMNHLFEQHQDFLDQPIIRSFLQTEDHLDMLLAAIERPTSCNLYQLNESFQLFYYRAKVYKYLSSFIYYFSVDYDKRLRKKRERYPTILDKFSYEYEGEYTLLNTIGYVDDRFEYIDSTDLSAQFSDEKLINAIEKLTQKQRTVLSMLYISGLSNKEIAEQFRETPQNISNIHKQAIKKTRKYYDIRKEIAHGQAVKK